MPSVVSNVNETHVASMAVSSITGFFHELEPRLFIIVADEPPWTIKTPDIGDSYDPRR
jgi:hypothetical protein